MNVLIADKFEAVGIEALKQLGCEIKQDADLSDDSLVNELASGNAEILIVRSTKVTAEMIDKASSLKLIIRAGSGYNTIDTAAARAKGIDVANTPGMNATAVAELAMGLILSLDRRIVHNTNDLRNGVWNKKEYSKARGLKGRTLGVVGIGQIGYLIAERAKAFEMKIVYSDIVVNEKAEKELDATKVEFEELLKQADFVTLHVPMNDSTKKMMNAKTFGMMKPTAFLINCSRGGVVDSADLVKALEDGVIAGAGLDVYENEPGASDKDFSDVAVKADMVYGTHHIGASTDQAQLAVAEEVVHVVDELMKTGKVIHCVNA